MIRDVPVLRLVDVGVSSGIHPLWRQWGNRLHAIGFDPLIDEVERLAEAETNPNVRYEAASVIGPATAPVSRTNYQLHRALCYLATHILEGRKPLDAAQYAALWRETVFGKAPVDATYSNFAEPLSDHFLRYYVERYNRGSAPISTDRAGTLDDLLGGFAPDVLKVDTDGHDFDVLRGGKRTLESCLAVDIEVQFNGPIGPETNVFCNIDTFLRDSGFTLLRLDIQRYGRSALPQPFLDVNPASTKSGPVQWADAFYARDLVTAPNARPDQIRNLALILERYELEDMAAEIVMARPELFAADALDALVRKVHGPGATHASVTAEFARDPLGFRRL